MSRSSRYAARMHALLKSPSPRFLLTLVASLFVSAACGGTPSAPTSAERVERVAEEAVADEALTDEVEVAPVTSAPESAASRYCAESFDDRNGCVPWLQLEVVGDEDDDPDGELEYSQYVRHPNGDFIDLPFTGVEDGGTPCTSELTGKRQGELLIIDWELSCRCYDCSDFENDPCIASDPWIGSRETIVLKVTADDLLWVTMVKENAHPHFEANGALLTRHLSNGDDRVVDLSSCDGCVSLLSNDLRTGGECVTRYDCPGGGCLDGRCGCDESSPCDAGSACLDAPDGAICVAVPEGCDVATTASAYSNACFAAIRQGDDAAAETPCTCAEAFAATGTPQTQRALYYNVGRYAEMIGSGEEIAAYCRSLAIRANAVVQRRLEAAWAAQN